MKKENEQPHVVLAGPASDIMPTDAEFKSNGNTDLQVSKDLPIQTLSVADIGALDEAEVAPIDLMSDYWTPKAPGEAKRVIFDKIDVSQVLQNDGTGEVIELECAFFLINDNGSAKRISKGSKRLVGSLQAANVRHGMALEITYLGKKKNATNSFMSDSWSVKPLVINKK